MFKQLTLPTRLVLALGLRCSALHPRARTSRTVTCWANGNMVKVNPLETIFVMPHSRLFPKRRSLYAHLKANGRPARKSGHVL